MRAQRRQCDGGGHALRAAQQRQRLDSGGGGGAGDDGDDGDDGGGGDSDCDGGMDKRQATSGTAASTAAT